MRSFPCVELATCLALCTRQTDQLLEALGNKHATNSDWLVFVGVVAKLADALKQEVPIVRLTLRYVSSDEFQIVRFDERVSEHELIISLMPGRLQKKSLHHFLA